MIYEKKLAQYGPLPIRILVGIAFIIHGVPKLSDIAFTEHLFTNIGLPGAMALLIGLLVVIGDIALLVGVLIRITSILFIIQMSGSIIVAKFPNGFVD